LKLLLFPLKKEWQVLFEYLTARNIAFEKQQIQGRWYLNIPTWQTRATVGGHGKSQMALGTQYWVDQFKDINQIILVGSAGALSPSLNTGDVLIVSDVLEHDFKSSVLETPQFKTRHETLDLNLMESDEFSIHVGRLASGDEDILSEKRASELKRQTQALAVAWESAGAARAADWNRIKFFELRGITDHCKDETLTNFNQNLNSAISHCLDIYSKLMT
jgi:adenosylhomocysteine nucleosidase